MTDSLAAVACFVAIAANAAALTGEEPPALTDALTLLIRGIAPTAPPPPPPSLSLPNDRHLPVVSRSLSISLRPRDAADDRRLLPLYTPSAGLCRSNGGELLLLRSLLDLLLDNRLGGALPMVRNTQARLGEHKSGWTDTGTTAGVMILSACARERACMGACVHGRERACALMGLPRHTAWRLWTAKHVMPARSKQKGFALTCCRIVHTL